MRMFLNAHARINAHPLSVDLFNLNALGICANGFGNLFIIIIIIIITGSMQNSITDDYQLQRKVILKQSSY